jgi:CheY-like chemotaxis protein
MPQCHIELLIPRRRGIQEPIMSCTRDVVSAPDPMERLQRQHINVPVLVVTGDISPRARASVQRADAYLMKPYDISALLTAVSDLTSASRV